MPNEITFTCEICGEAFEPTPDAMIEWEMGAQIVPESEAENGISREELEAMNEFDLKALGLTPELQQAMLRGEDVKFGGCVCLKCQDRMLAEQEA